LYRPVRTAIPAPGAGGGGGPGQPVAATDQAGQRPIVKPRAWLVVHTPTNENGIFVANQPGNFANTKGATTFFNMEVPVSNFLSGLLEKVCSSEEALAASLGLSEWQFAFAKTALYLALLALVLPGWLASWPRLKANGFSKKVWLAGIWVLGGFSFVQVAKAMSQPAIGSPIIPCPHDFVASGTVVVLALYALYFYHLGRGNRGSFAKFFMLVVLPIFGEVVVNVRDVEFGSLQILFRLWKVVVPLVHV
jgi:hypothetical protein